MRNVLLLFLPLFVIACSKDALNRTEKEALEVEARSQTINANAAREKLPQVLSIDHSLLAQQAGEDLAASKVELFTDDALNSALISENIEVGIDLPFRVLNFSQDGVVTTRYTSADFLRIRHGLSDTELLTRFDQEVGVLVQGVPDAKAITTEGLTKGYAITRMRSDYAFDETIARIKEQVLAQEGAKWFLTHDYARKAELQGMSLPKATLLVFGAPGPGAKAMGNFPTIGLDTFGQKVFVYQKGEQVIVIYNDILDMARLHYQDSEISHRVVNLMLGKTVSGAIEK